MERSAAFYDALAKELGIGRFMEFDGFISWGSPGVGAGLGVCKPYNGEPASVGNGGMAGIAAKSKEQVDRLYAVARELGAACEGPPGPRSDSFYAAYFRDPDGNKLNAFYMGA
jgi:catechol 2,3-dioxygenase-like lactoylglutathione lyase family enzyme